MTSLFDDIDVVHLLVLRHGVELTAGCGATGEARPYMPDNFTVWMQDVTCTDCLARDRSKERTQ